MADYFNAKETLPAELISEVLEHLPEGSHNGAVIYFSDDFYARRNSEIVRCFRIYQSDSCFGSHMEIYEALSEQFGLTVRQICKIVKDARDGHRGPPCRQRRYSGIRVGRVLRRMSIHTKTG